MNEKITIREIANALNISVATVSYVVNGKGKEKRIGTDLIKRINDYVLETGYQINQVARSLRTGKSKIIGMLIEDIADPFFSKIAGLIEARLNGLGYRLFVSSTKNDSKIERDSLEIFRSLQIDGYIIAPTPFGEEMIEGLLKSDNPMILFDRYFPSIDTHNVVIENAKGSKMAVNHLADNGFCNIGFITLQSDQTQMAERYRGFEEAIKNNNIEGKTLRLPFGISEAELIERIGLFLKNNPQLDACLFATNYLAVPGLRAIQLPEYAVHRDLGLVSFDDSSYNLLLQPSLTTVVQPIADMSLLVVEKLMNQINTHGYKPMAETSVLPVTLEIRDSSSANRHLKLLKYG